MAARPEVLYPLIIKIGVGTGEGVGGGRGRRGRACAPPPPEPAGGGGGAGPGYEITKLFSYFSSVDAPVPPLVRCVRQCSRPTLDFKTSCSGGGGAEPPAAPEQHFNIFPAIFSRQLNFQGAAANAASGAKSAASGLMDELRPNLPGLLGLAMESQDDKRLAKAEADFLYSLPQDTSTPPPRPPALHDHTGTVLSIITSASVLNSGLSVRVRRFSFVTTYLRERSFSRMRDIKTKNSNGFYEEVKIFSTNDRN